MADALILKVKDIMKLINYIAPILVIIAAVIDSVFGILPELGLTQNQITWVKVIGLIIGIVLAKIKPESKDKNGTGNPPIGGGGGTPPKP